MKRLLSVITVVICLLSVSLAKADEQFTVRNAIINCRLVNRLAEIYGVSPLFLGDDKERLQVADFCLDTVIMVFNNRIL